MELLRVFSEICLPIPPPKILSLRLNFLVTIGFKCSRNEEGDDEEGRDLVNPPSKSLSCNTIRLQEANQKMNSHFENI